MTKKNIKALLAKKLVALWYRPKLSYWLIPLVPFSLIVQKIAKRRYKRALLQQHSDSKDKNLPTIVVGNVTVGGTGKTPLVASIASYLKASGFSPGIISRGYGATLTSFPVKVLAHSDPAIYGDEPVLLAQLTGIPVAISPLRVEAARLLEKTDNCNILISDDGLQHYALKRNIEIVVLDGMRSIGNGFCLPAGPLRESANRLKIADLIVSKGLINRNSPVFSSVENMYTMSLETKKVENLTTDIDLSLPEFSRLHSQVHAIAGIGNPEPFFNTLEQAGLTVIRHGFPDHHAYHHNELVFKDSLPVIMTAKDAVKCKGFVNQFTDNRFWCLQVTVQLTQDFWHAFEELVMKRCKHAKNSNK